MNWYKKGKLASDVEFGRETWIREDSDNSVEFPIDLYLGKKTNLLDLKKNIVRDIPNQIEYYKNSRESVYKPENLEEVKQCPVCNEASSSSSPQVIIYGAEYVQCSRCTHVYVLKRPLQSDIEGFYLNDVNYAATYTDKAAAESRLNAIAVPWVEWMIEVFTKQYGFAPKKILDVGSGAGHFVEACRRKGLQANGVELSQSSRDFSKQVWGIELEGEDFLKIADKFYGYDVVTFWGLLEHTPNPKSILSAAFDIVSKSENGMVISKIPRWDSLSTAIQRMSKDTIIRHLDPMGHIMCFTDSSSAEIYYQCGFAPIASWYYGMDVYETLMQLGNKSSNYDVLHKTKDIQTDFQQFIDNVKFSDGLTLAGIPLVNN